MSAESECGFLPIGCSVQWHSYYSAGSADMSSCLSFSITVPADVSEDKHMRYYYIGRRELGDFMPQLNQPTCLSILLSQPSFPAVMTEENRLGYSPFGYAVPAYMFDMLNQPL